MTIDVLVLGGAHIDRRGRISACLVAGASNPGSWIEEPGGGGFNAARSLSRLGLSVTMVSPRGGDATGEKVTEAALAAGVDDRPFVFLDRATPTYTAILENDGNLVVGLADMELYRLFTPRRLQVKSVREAMAQARIVVVDANLPTETLEAIAAITARQGQMLAGIAISPAKVIRYRNCLDKLDWLFLNEAEAAALTGRAGSAPLELANLLRAEGLKAAVVTRGPSPALCFHASGAFTIDPPPLSAIRDVTGAGDSLAAGMIYALARGFQPPQALRHGVALAGLTLLSPQAIVADLHPDQLGKALTRVAEAVPLGS
ncbi:carbohydrate kinase family protein [Allorhizobium undicola]|uniref:carbohydrate kinase family protein n=1 Tax=Allorhizobium undicola TaxID=78527 RepID=UPI003D34C67A